MAGASRRGASPAPSAPAPIAATSTGANGGRAVVTPVSPIPRPVSAATTPEPTTPPVRPWSVAMPSVV